ncbi:MAG: FHA domain-containing protein [Polyangiaceae bacterium]|nr:FHA domain-containing protein [Polyangiaceae bacterium]
MSVEKSPPRRAEPEADGSSNADGVGARYWLEHAGHAFELRQGPIVVGRSSDCNLVVDDASVSRRHAQLKVEGGRVFVEDLGSANGVLVNDERIDRRRELQPDDRIGIGKQQMVIRVRTTTASRAGGQPRRTWDQTISGIDTDEMADHSPTQTDVSPAGRGYEALDLISGVVDKVLALGRADEAERMLAMRLHGLLEAAQARRSVSAHNAERAARYAVKLAAATGKSGWVDYVFQLYGCLGRPLPGEIVDELYQVLRRVNGVSVDGLREYIATLRAHQSEYGPAERFLVQRIEGLERLAALL